MLKLVSRRLLALVPLLFIVSVLTFSFTSLLPSDPVDLIICGVAFVVPILYALIVFPRRDLGAPA